MLPARRSNCPSFFFFNDTATTEIYTLSLHDALPISLAVGADADVTIVDPDAQWVVEPEQFRRSEEHTSELQSRPHIVCRLLLEKNTSFNVSSLSTAVCVNGPPDRLAKSYMSSCNASM